MSTRANIGLYDATTNTVKFIYNHFDGYPAGVGNTLLKHYTDPETIEKLLSGGDVRTLGETPETSDYFGGEQDKAQTTNTMDYRHGQEYNYIFINGEWFYNSELMTGGDQQRYYDALDNWRAHPLDTNAMKRFEVAKFNRFTDFAKLEATKERKSLFKQF